MNVSVAVVSAHSWLYRIARSFLFRYPAQQAHDHLLRVLEWCDNQPSIVGAAHLINHLTAARHDFVVGGVRLHHPLMMAAGFVKGKGYATEEEALAAVAKGENLIPGWRIVPALVGIVEFGSYTRYPRTGNSGTIIWRHASTRSLQNRVGLRNPGAAAASLFLSKHKAHLPPVFGINVAVSPGLNETAAEAREVAESLALFLTAGVVPSWFTLNISCPNTEDDPKAHQTEAHATALCEASLAVLRHTNVPLWVKIGPDLSVGQLGALARVFAKLGVRAIVATNTLPRPVPQNPTLRGGMSGRTLLPHVLHTLSQLYRLRFEIAADFDLVASGGILDAADIAAAAARGARVAQCYSAFVFNGPLALQKLERDYNA
jgi:dihydroorotate dehydrogenase